MKKMLFLAALLLAATQAVAGNVDLAAAQTKAADFLLKKTPQGRLMASKPTVKWTHEVKNSSNVAQTAYYIVNTDRGYAIVAGDDRARDVLVYGDQPLADLNDLPDGVQFFLRLYKAEMEYLQAHPGLVVNKHVNRGGVSVEPLLKTAWAQGKPYNMQCPRVGRDYCMVGCTATSLAQVMKFWEYPEVAPALPAYQCPDSKINVPALPEYTFDWDNMWDTYEAYSNNTDQLPDVNKDAVAWLMRYVGQAETIDYNTDKSGTQNYQILNAIRTFGYDEGVYIAKKYDSPDYDGDYENHDGHEFYTDEQWGELIQAELLAGRPLVYCAYDMSSDSTGLGGHAFNVDGYDAENDLYHVNFGMRSDLNAYYALNAFQIDFITIYDFWPIFFAGVQPPGLSTDPRILTDVQELSMSCYTGETVTDTLTVKGQYLTEGIAVALNDENGAFAIDVTSIALDQVGNASIVVTYAPQAVGTHTATITLTSAGAADKVVTLKGTATAAPLVVYDPVMQPADSSAINLTSFRADWTDQTVLENVTSYTLEVKEKPTSGLIAEADWSEVPSSGDAANYMPEGWTYDGGVYLAGGCIEISSTYSLFTNTLDLTGFDKVTVVIRARNQYSWTASAVTVKTSVDSKYQEFATDFADYTFVLNCGDSERIEIYSESYYPVLQSVKVYAGELTAPQLRAQETGDAAYRLITGITDKFYTVNDLTAEGTYLYKVKALYADGTESAWSNTQQVTLFANGHGFDLGDVNHDGSVNIKDVTDLIDYLLSGGDGICQTCADVRVDGAVNIADVTALIDVLLGGN